MPIEEKKNEPEEQKPRCRECQWSGISAMLSKTVDEGVDGCLPDAVTAGAVYFREQVGKQGITADDLQRECRAGETPPAAVKEKMEHRQQKDAPAAAPQHGGGGVDMFDKRGIRFQQEGSEQAAAADEEQFPGGAESPARADEAAADTSHERERPEREGGENPAVGCTVLPCSLEKQVYMECQIVIRQEESGRLPIVWDKAQQRPIADKAEQAAHSLSAQTAEQ